MWYKNKDGIEVFNFKDHRGYFYQVTNELPKRGDKCYVALEHDHAKVIIVNSVDTKTSYPINNNYKYGIVPLRDNRGVYGVGKIVWTDNPYVLLIKY